MTLKRNTFEGGTSGTAITSAVSGGANGDQFSAGGNGADATRAWSNAQAMHGGLSALFTIASTGTANNAAIGYGGYTATSIAHRFYVRFNAMPSVNSLLAGVFYTGGVGVNTTVLSTGAIRVSDYAGATKYTSPVLSLDTWYRIEQVVIRGTTTTDGTINVAVYAGDSTTALHTYSASNIDTGSAQTIANVQWGRPGTTATATAYSFHVDDVAANDGATTFIGPVAANAAPTVNAGPDQTNVEPWAPVTLTATAADADGTTPAVSWAQTAGSPTVTLSGAGAARTFTAPGTLAGTTLTFTATASDGTLSASDPMSVTVLPVTERAVIGGVEVPMQIRGN